METFINEINNSGLMTSFIKNIFDYTEFNDYNYLFRMKSEKNKIIIDIYDNISDNRFNRYVFFFSNEKYEIKKIEIMNVFVTYINIYKLKGKKEKIYKLAYLFNPNIKNMLEYAETFLNKEFVIILKNILNKPIH